MNDPLSAPADRPPRVAELRGYGVAFSDLEALWPPSLKKKMKRDGMAALMTRLGFFERFRFFWAFVAAKKRADKLDLAEIRSRGMTNEAFLDQQREFLAMYAALVEVVGKERAIEINRALMDATAKEPMLLVLPDRDEVRAAGDPFTVMRDYLRPVPEAGRKAGCQDITLRESEQEFGFDVTRCVWLELARQMGVPDATLGACYSDEIAFPEYFRSLGMRYSRTGTLAGGAKCCDFRFKRVEQTPG